MDKKLHFSTPEHNGQSLEIHVIYNTEKKEVTGITGVYVRTPHMVMNISELSINIVTEIGEAISKIIARVGWQDIYEHSETN